MGYWLQMKSTDSAASLFKRRELNIIGVVFTADQFPEVLWIFGKDFWTVGNFGM